MIVWCELMAATGTSLFIRATISASSDFFSASEASARTQKEASMLAMSSSSLSTVVWYLSKDAES